MPNDSRRREACIAYISTSLFHFSVIRVNIHGESTCFVHLSIYYYSNVFLDTSNPSMEKSTTFVKKERKRNRIIVVTMLEKCASSKNLESGFPSHPGDEPSQEPGAKSQEPRAGYRSVGFGAFGSPDHGQLSSFARKKRFVSEHEGGNAFERGAISGRATPGRGLRE